MKGWVGVPEKKRKSLSEKDIKQYQNEWDLNILNVLNRKRNISIWILSLASSGAWDHMSIPEV